MLARMGSRTTGSLGSPIDRKWGLGHGWEWWWLQAWPCDLCGSDVRHEDAICAMGMCDTRMGHMYMEVGSWGWEWWWWWLQAGHVICTWAQEMLDRTPNSIV